MTIRSCSPEETVRFGERIAAALRPPAVVMLIGELGTGKTTLAKGIVSALGAASADDVVSPTFSLIRVYDGATKVYHLDLFRLDTVPQLETLGLEDLWDEPAVVIIEWGERFVSELPGERVEVRLEHDADSRILQVEGLRWPAPPPRGDRSV